MLLSLVAHAGTRPDASGPRAEALKTAMQTGADAMGDITMPQFHKLGFEQANAALAALKGLAPLEKGTLMRGLFAAVTADATRYKRQFAIHGGLQALVDQTLVIP